MQARPVLSSDHNATYKVPAVHHVRQLPDLHGRCKGREAADAVSEPQVEGRFALLSVPARSCCQAYTGIEDGGIPDGQGYSKVLPIYAIFGIVKLVDGTPWAELFAS
jgi:hypothetical protein